MKKNLVQMAEGIGLSFADQLKIEELLGVILGSPDDLTHENQEAIGVYSLEDEHLGDIISDGTTFTYAEASAKAANVVKTADVKPAKPQGRSNCERRRAG